MVCDDLKTNKGVTIRYYNNTINWKLTYYRVSDARRSKTLAETTTNEELDRILANSYISGKRDGAREKERRGKERSWEERERVLASW